MTPSALILDFGEVLTKPQPRRCDPAIYRASLERLDTPASPALFADDRSENPRGAEAILQTYHVTGDSSIDGLKRILEL